MERGIEKKLKQKGQNRKVRVIEMVVRKRKRSNKKRGGRTQHGNKKNWRGKGTRGGRGRAGSHKHKYSKYYATFGVKVRLKTKSRPAKAINFKTLNALIPKWLSAGLCEKTSEDKIVLDGRKIGVDKILGSGKLDFDVEFKNVALSQKAKNKLEGIEFETEK